MCSEKYFIICMQFYFFFCAKLLVKYALCVLRKILLKVLLLSVCILTRSFTMEFEMYLYSQLSVWMLWFLKLLDSGLHMDEWGSACHLSAFCFRPKSVHRETGGSGIHEKKHWFETESVPQQHWRQAFPCTFFQAGWWTGQRHWAQGTQSLS